MASTIEAAAEEIGGDVLPLVRLDRAPADRQPDHVRAVLLHHRVVARVERRHRLPGRRAIGERDVENRRRFHVVAAQDERAP